MNDVKEFSLPASGYDVIAKILHGETELKNDMLRP